jgi:hypothetical protein
MQQLENAPEMILRYELSRSHDAGPVRFKARTSTHGAPIHPMLILSKVLSKVFPACQRTLENWLNIAGVWQGIRPHTNFLQSVILPA